MYCCRCTAPTASTPERRGTALIAGSLGVPPRLARNCAGVSGVVGGLQRIGELEAGPPSLVAGLAELDPRYASYLIWPARLSAARWPHWTPPSDAAFSILSPVREASPPSLVGGLGTWTSHERV